MKKLIYIICSFILICLFFLGNSDVFAGRDLTGEELTELFTGKTAEGFHPKKGYTFKVYYSPDGTMQGEFSTGEKRTGKWYINHDKGLFCGGWLSIGKKVGCGGLIVKEDDGTYKHFGTRKGKRKHKSTYTKFTDGDQLKH